MPFAALFADGIDVNSPEYKLGVLIGSLFAGVVCGLWPLSTGLKKGRPVMGAVGFATCIPCGYLLGCLLALPVAFMFKLLISALPEPEPQSFGDSRYPSSDRKCGQCGALSMAGDTSCYSCRQPLGRTNDGNPSPLAVIAGAAAAVVGYVLVQRFFQP